MSIQRYDVVGYGQQDIVRSDTGEFVDFADHCKEIDRLTRELAEAKALAIDWISHPETIEAKRQWDAVAEALGADKNCPDLVLRAAKARAVIPDGWVAVPAEPTDDMELAAEVSKPRGYRDLYRAMLSARPEFPPNGLPKESSDVE